MLVDEPSDGVRRLTIDRPDQLNAISIDVLRAIVAGADDADAHGARAIVLTGAGRAFSAGYDIHEFSALTAKQHLMLETERGELVERWFACPVPTIAALNRICYGGGTILAVATDLRVAGPGLGFKVTAASYGGANLTWMLPRLVGVGRARELLMTSRLVSGTEAAAIGLVERLVDDNAVADAAVELASEIAAHPPAGPRAVKALINDGLGQQPARALAAENYAQLQMLTRPVGAPRFTTFLERTRGAAPPETAPG